MGTVPVKRKFLAVYNYGMGGSWMFINARSAGEIRARYPILDVVESIPEWMTPEVRRQIERVHTYDIDDPPTGSFLALLKEHGYDESAENS